jgi:hypothetical protein
MDSDDLIWITIVYRCDVVDGPNRRTVIVQLPMTIYPLLLAGLSILPVAKPFQS